MLEADLPESSEERLEIEGEAGFMAGSVAGIGVLFEAGIGLLALGVGLLVGIWPAETLRWTVEGLLIGILATIPLLGTLAICERSKSGHLSDLRRFVMQEIAPIFKESSWMGLALLSIAAGFGEELCFRGLIQGGLERVAPFWAALVAASLIFGLAHPITPLYAFLVTLVGLYLGLVWSWSGNLLSVVTTHALYDFVALLWIRRDLRVPGNGESTSGDT